MSSSSAVVSTLHKTPAGRSSRLFASMTEAPYWPASFDWALLCLRLYCGISLFVKHGTEKLLHFSAMVPNFYDPLHIGLGTSLAIATLADAICTIMVVLGISTRLNSFFVFCNVFVAWALVKHFEYFGKGLKPDHGELIWLYMGAYLALALMGPGRFSVDYAAGLREFWPLSAGWRMMGAKRSIGGWQPGTRDGSAPIIEGATTGRNVVWTVLIAGIIAIGSFAVWKQKNAPPSAGQNAPKFTLPSQDGTSVSLSRYAGKWVVLFFYPGDGGQEDALEAKSFQRDVTSYEAAGAVVLGINPQTPATHQDFSSRQSIHLQLLSANQQVIDDYDVPMQGHGDAREVERDTFLIAPNGVIVTFWNVKNLQDHSRQVLAAIAAAKKKPLPLPTRRASS